MTPSLPQRAATALRKLETSGRIESAWLGGMMVFTRDLGVRRLTRGPDEDGDFMAEGCIVPAKSLVMPDLSDPLTIQGLLLLVREASDDPLATVDVMVVDDVDVFWTTRWEYDEVWSSGSSGVTEAEALVNALESLVEVDTPAPMG